ncbi:MAG: flavin reductase family protein [Nocardioidaceae bacterium]
MQQVVRDLPTTGPIWDRFFAVAPLVVVGTLEPDGSVDLAPKHMAMPLGWENRWCFVCSPRHATYRNARARRAFTASFPRPEQLVAVSLAAGPRERDGAKPSLAGVPTFPARAVEGALVEGCLLWLECELERVVDGFGDNSLVVGRIVAAAAPEEAVRDADRDDAELLRRCPPTVYVSPGRVARAAETWSFPLHAGFRR